MYFVEVNFDDCGGCFEIDANSEHEAYRKLLDLLEADGLRLDDVESFSLTEI